MHSSHEVDLCKVAAGEGMLTVWKCLWLSWYAANMAISTGHSQRARGSGCLHPADHKTRRPADNLTDKHTLLHWHHTGYDFLSWRHVSSTSWLFLSFPSFFDCLSSFNLSQDRSSERKVRGHRCRLVIHCELKWGKREAVHGPCGCGIPSLWPEILNTHRGRWVRR